ncbi:MAG: type I restriction enzyme HsdR N-terminal domain-containing protein [Patescibacteria group bacterium]|nr:type I restriction enzyme HsdR N-terminal domain-containing protein [Patescibacteria group bacterium]
MSVNYQLQKEKIISGSNDYLKLGQKKGYFVLDGNKIKYSASGKKYSFLNPEEKVRAKYYFNLIEKYKYPPEKICFEVEMEDRTPNRFADMVIYGKNNKPYIVIECKKDGISDAEFEQATKQSIANARVLKAPFAVIVAGNTKRAMETDRWNSKTQEKAIITDIPILYGKIEEFRYKKGDKN